MKRKSLLISAIVLVVALIIPISQAGAVNQPWIKVTGGVAGICDFPGGILLIPFSSYIDNSGSNEAMLEVPGVGRVGYYSEDHFWTVIGDGTYGLPTSPFSVPANTALTATIITYNEYGLSVVNSVSWVLFDCTTGAVINSYFGTGGFEGPPIPAGFVQHNIVCDTPVFEEPAGDPVESDMVYAGQDWHLNPTPVMGPDGQYWTQIFVSGVYNPYIPTRCVGTPTQ